MTEKLLKTSATRTDAAFARCRRAVSVYRAVGGFDERYEGWGVEDLDMRLQISLFTNAIFGEVSLSLLTAVPPDEELRTQFYAEKNAKVSDQKLHSGGTGDIARRTAIRTEYP